ncbi:sensor domain-containing diguanylate cyclase [Deinococcus deserti]|uniref:Putative diguanylate-cyclase n=1 Tax=Deinococcus deserti (strain DSM 17065 / CIP 109153 / LMG 22923 / VCD115) TaxID=546414 RepID=C1D2Y2_DEIDV|nr:sensor domain-containing diguanylate cyclase [Deinococcus deserti]ACO47771.1 putative diguanylate-cyclase [Deinococcus deserti VCD115]
MSESGAGDEATASAQVYSQVMVSLASCRSAEELRDRLVQAFPEGPVVVTTGPDWSVEWRGKAGAEEADPAHLVAFGHFRDSVTNLRDTLLLLGRSAQLSQLALSFAGRGTDQQVIRSALPQLMEVFGLLGVQGLRDHHGRLVPEPAWTTGTIPEVTFTREDLAACRQGKPLIRPGGLLLPLAGRWRARIALWLPDPGRRWSRDELQLLDIVARAISTEYDRIQSQRHLSELLSMQRSLLENDPESAYRPLLQQALQQIPGAQSGSLLVRDGELFRYAAAVTFDEAELSQVSFRIDDTRDNWYGLGKDAWLRGVPRILRNARLHVQGSGFLREGEYHEGTLPSVDHIAANIGVPILHHGEVYAFLNIDAHNDPDAFAEDSVEVARSFAVQAALLLHEAWQRSRIQHAARTDVLTGLPNRRAFTECLEGVVANAQRHKTPLSLLLADITRFKAINDTLGHAAGDQALVEVGTTLRECLRAGDHVFRWGGDEFALLLPYTTLEGALQVAERIREALARRVACHPALELNMGAATLRTDDMTGSFLLRDADAAMYQQKRESHSRIS